MRTFDEKGNLLPESGLEPKDYVLPALGGLTAFTAVLWAWMVMA